MSAPEHGGEANGIPEGRREPARALVERELAGSRGIVLDVDDTIVDTRSSMMEAGTAGMAALWPERVGEHASMAQRYYTDPARWFARYASGEVEFAAMRRGRLEEVAAAFTLALPPDGHGAFENAYAPAFRSGQRLFPDVDALIDAADELGIPLALLTNSSAEATALKLEALAITHRFGAVVTTDTLGVGKPDPRTYLEACRLAGTRPSETVCIGDNLEWDVFGARSAGLRAVWIDRDGGVHRPAVPPVPTVRSLDELTTVLKKGRFGQPPRDG